jgi:hypothetical protein
MKRRGWLGVENWKSKEELGFSLDTPASVYVQPTRIHLLPTLCKVCDPKFLYVFNIRTRRLKTPKTIKPKPRQKPKQNTQTSKRSFSPSQDQWEENP